MLKNRCPKVGFISSYVPHKCGVACFTADLLYNIRLAAGRKFDPRVIAVQPCVELDYREPVTLVIRKEAEYHYHYAAEQLNSSDIDVVSLQHNFTLFGGKGGSHINILLKELHKPVITTLHAIPEQPDTEYFDALVRICGHSERIVVMNQRSKMILCDIYGLPKGKINLIRHGIPEFDLRHCDEYKEMLGLSGKKIVLAIGPFRKKKILINTLRAFAEIVKEEPTAMLILSDRMHDHLPCNDHGIYWLETQRLIGNFDLAGRVRHCGQLLSNGRSYQLLGAADVCLSTHMDHDTESIGTLSLAIGAGKAVVSVPSWAAHELLSQGRGKILRTESHKEIAKSVLAILSSPSAYEDMRVKAYKYGKTIAWSTIGKKYWNLFSKLSAADRNTELVEINNTGNHDWGASPKNENSWL